MSIKYLTLLLSFFSLLVDEGSENYSNPLYLCNKLEKTVSGVDPRDSGLISIRHNMQQLVIEQLMSWWTCLITTVILFISNLTLRGRV